MLAHSDPAAAVMFMLIMAGGFVVAFVMVRGFQKMAEPRKVVDDQPDRPVGFWQPPATGPRPPAPPAPPQVRNQPRYPE